MSTPRWHRTAPRRAVKLAKDSLWRCSFAGGSQSTLTLARSEILRQASSSCAQSGHESTWDEEPTLGELTCAMVISASSSRCRVVSCSVLLLPFPHQCLLGPVEATFHCAIRAHTQHVSDLGVSELLSEGRAAARLHADRASVQRDV